MMHVSLHSGAPCCESRWTLAWIMCRLHRCCNVACPRFSINFFPCLLGVVTFCVWAMLLHLRWKWRSRRLQWQVCLARPESLEPSTPSCPACTPFPRSFAAAHPAPWAPRGTMWFLSIVRYLICFSWFDFQACMWCIFRNARARKACFEQSV